LKITRLKDLITIRPGTVAAENYHIRYAADRFLSRLAESEYKNKFIVKGGFLQGVIYNLEQRATRDLDASIRDMEANYGTIKKAIEEICSIDLNDNVSFEIRKIENSQDERIYSGFRVKLKMVFLEERTKIDFDLDIGIGDKITPEAELIQVPLLFNEEKGKQEIVEILGYPKETSQAEKLETILVKGLSNSRMKDFYDMHLFYTDPAGISTRQSYNAFVNTWNFRHPETKIDEELFLDWFDLLEDISNERRFLDEYWPNYIKDKPAASKLKFEDIIQEIIELLENIQKEYMLVSK
jgi:hypothetical protein